MKKTKTITVPAVKRHTKEVAILVCDFCGSESQVGRGILECDLCGRHICNGLLKGCAQWDRSNPGDYPAAFCPICDKLKFGKYNNESSIIEEEYYDKLKALEQRIKTESLQMK